MNTSFTSGSSKKPNHFEPNENTALVDHEKSENGGKAKEKTGYPLSIIFIIGNEFCERFSYYGMKTVLTLYFVQYLYYDRDTSTTIYHTFSMLCYFTPIIGAIISDSYLGKFKTIFYISIVYVLGNIVLSASAIPGYQFQSAITMVGLALIAFGTGGIKPCVAAFGGDQFGPGQELQLERFFSIFYMAINAGSLLSTVVTPMLRGDVKCWGDDCYALAFGVPAVLMIVALILFLIGKPQYKMNPPEGNVIVQVTSCIFHALSNRGKNGKKEHWLDHADDKYQKSLIEDIKSVLHVLVLYLPLPVFWALFDQQGSRWLLQATQMDGEITSGFRVKPDQVQVINPLLIVACIPLFQYAIYPLFNKLHIVRTPLQRMTFGGILAAAAFVVAFFVELELEKTLPVHPENGFGQANFISALPCDLNVTGQDVNIGIIKNKNMYDFKDMPAGERTLRITSENCSSITESKEINYTISNLDIQTTFLFELDNEINYETVSDTLAKPEKGESNLRIVYYLSYELTNHDTFSVNGDENNYKIEVKPSNSTGKAGITDYKLIVPGKYKIYIDKLNSSGESVAELEVKMGGSYILQIDEKQPPKTHVLVEPNSMSILIQFPQYVIITFGEIMFSITGLEFSYSQAPASMKSVLQAGWLMTVAFGNLIVVIVSTGAHMRQAYEFIMFAGLMVLDMIIFAIMAYFYKYNETGVSAIEQFEKSPEKSETLKSNNGIANDGFDNSKTTPM